MLIRNAPGAAPTTPQLHQRLRYCIVVIAIAFLILVGRLWNLQISRGEEYRRQTRRNVVNRQYLPSVRGKIVDQKGRPIADNRPAFNLYAKPLDIQGDEREQLARVLSLSKDEQERIYQRFQRAFERDRHQPALLLEDIGRERASLVKQEQQSLSAFSIRDEPYRNYPNGEVLAHLVGYMNQINAKELKDREDQGYEATELIGRYGLERAWENYLRGKKGFENYVVNAKGQRVTGTETEGLIEGPKFVPPVAGHNVFLTIDLELQKVLERELARHAAGAAAVVEVDSGRILALASTPAFDPNVMTGHLTREREAQMLADPRKPFIDKTLHQHYPPGSTYKFVTAIAAIEDGLIGSNEPLSCPGYHQQGKRTFRCTNSHGKVDLVTAIQHSCNVYFWKLAERVGIDRMAEVAREFGFGSSTGLGLNGDVMGLVPTKEWYDQRGTFKIGYTLNAATGQGDVEVGVLQLAMAYAALANGGRLYVPQVVDRVETAAGEVAVIYEPVLRQVVKVTPGSLELIHRGMWMVVNTPGGTANAYAHSDIVEISGKTGTAQVRAMKRRDDDELIKGWHPFADHAWFAGFAPSSAPEVAIVVLVEHGGAGGKQAGPIARAVIESYWSTRHPAAPATSEEP